jgi:hypothetical protein
MPRFRLLAATAVLTLANAAPPVPSFAAPSEQGSVLFRQADATKVHPIKALRNLPGRTLRNAGSNGLAVEIRFARDLEDSRIVSHADGIEFFVLAGDISLGTVRLGTGDFAYIPANNAYGPFRASAGTKILVFSKGAATLSVAKAVGNTAAWTVVRSATMPWSRSTTGAEAGTALAIDVKFLWADPTTGRSTFLARMDAGTVIPWESHPVDEEGYLISGAHDVEECPPSGLVHGRYSPGGYFFRPPNLIHMGPRSVNPIESIWLIRTSGTLADHFYAACPFQKAAK